MTKIQFYSEKNEWLALLREPDSWLNGILQPHFPVELIRMICGYYGKYISVNEVTVSGTVPLCATIRRAHCDVSSTPTHTYHVLTDQRNYRLRDPLPELCWPSVTRFCRLLPQGMYATLHTDGTIALEDKRSLRNHRTYPITFEYTHKVKK